MHILIPILILLAILFRREMRALAQLFGLVLLGIIVYFGVCFVQWEQTHEETLCPNGVICDSYINTNTGSQTIATVVCPNIPDIPDDPIKLLKSKWWDLALLRWTYINNFRDDIKRLGDAAKTESENDDQWKGGDWSSGGLSVELALNQKEIFNLNAKMRTLERAIDVLEKGSKK